MPGYNRRVFAFCQGPPQFIIQKSAHKKRLYHDEDTKQVQGILMAAVEQYVVDDQGNKVAIILPLTEYQHLKEDLHDLAMVAERRDEGSMSLAELKKRVL